MRKICIQYGIEDPSFLLRQKPPSKKEFKNDIETRILSFHERELRKRATEIKRMKYFNCSLLGLSSKCHPAIKGIYTTNEVKRCRIHTKMLFGDLYTYEVKSQQLGGSPHCRNCVQQNQTPENDNTLHILTTCDALTSIREIYLSQFEKILQNSNLVFEELKSDKEELCQFILDPTSFNLRKRINFNDPIVDELFRISRNFCHSMNEKRLKLIGSRKI